MSIPAHSDFTLQNLPFGIFTARGFTKRVGVAIGDQIVDLDALQQNGLLDHPALPQGIFRNEVLNPYMAMGRSVWSYVRHRLTELLSQGNSEMSSISGDFLLAQADATMHMPVRVGDYTDFYSSKEHATNVGIMFRGKENALMPNWTHMPVAYHGRSSSIEVSGTPVRRPWGQLLPAGEETPTVGPSKLLDMEVEMAFLVGKENALGQPVPVKEAEEHIFGMLLFNDWSARDIQKWEYVPLGPFLGKNFASTVSPWVVPMDALKPFRVASPVHEREPLPYLQGNDNRSYDIHIEAFLAPKDGEEVRICQTNHKYLYWTLEQQLAHHTLNGCNLKIGDMCASGTISGPTQDSFGSLMELTWKGENPITLADGSQRKFLQDGDRLVLRAYAEKDGVRVGFGEVSSEILPALDLSF